jgi:hypothetical protein
MKNFDIKTLVLCLVVIAIAALSSCTNSEATTTTKSAMSDSELEAKDKYKDCTLFENYDDNGITVTITKKYVDSTETIVKFDSITIGSYSKDTLSRTSYQLR